MVTSVHRFTNAPDGAYPETPLAVAGNTIYGTTFSGGTGSPVGGTIFSVTSKGVKILHSLASHAPNSAGPPRAGVRQIDQRTLWRDVPRGQPARWNYFSI